MSVATAALLPEGPAAEVAVHDGGDTVSVEHPTGTFDAAVRAHDRWAADPVVERAGIIRTARKLMDGMVFAEGVMERDDPAAAPRPPPAAAVHAARQAPATPTATCSGPPTASRSPPTRSYTPPDAGIDDFERLQERLGLSRAVFVQASCHGTDNAAMLDALRRGNGRYAGVAMIDDASTDAEIAELHDAGVRGTRFNFVAHLGGAPDLRRSSGPWRGWRREAGTSCSTSTPPTCPPTPTCSTACPAPT